MKALAQTSTGGSAYSAQETYNLFCQTNLELFVVDWLGPDGHSYQDVTPWVTGTSQIQHDSSSAVKRTCTITFDLGLDTPFGSWPSQINLYKDAFKIWHYVRDPLVTGSLLRFDLGTFVYSNAQPIHNTWGDQVTWTGADLGQLLTYDKFQSSFAINAGASVVQSVAQIVAGIQGAIRLETQIPELGQVVGASLSWDAGTTKLQALGDLLTAANYYTPWFDGMTCRSRPIVDTNALIPNWLFDSLSGVSIITATPPTEDPDYAAGANVIVVVGQAPQTTTSNTTTTTTPAAAPTATYTNDRWDSPVSTANWFRTVQYISDSTITDEGTAQIRAKAEAQSYARIYSPFSLYTVPWGFWEDHDFVEVRWSNPSVGIVDETYEVLGWTLQCAPGAEMTHNLQRVVPA